MMIIYHDDLDGQCSAAIVNEFYKCGWINDIGSGYGIKLYPMNHGDRYPFDQIDIGEKVYILDFPPPPPGHGLHLITKKTTDIIWIDHHQSAIDRFKDIDFEGVLSPGHPSACQLTWEYMRKRSILTVDAKDIDQEIPDDIPNFIKMISDHDSYQHDVIHSESFCYGLLGCENVGTPTSKIWEKLFFEMQFDNDDRNPFNADIIKKGFSIRQFLKNLNKDYISGFAYGLEWEGYRCLVCNKGICGKRFFESEWDPTVYDIMIAYVFDGEKYSVSLYTDKEEIKVNKIAAKYGGGGHDGAAGFEPKELPWESEDLKAVLF